MKVRSELNYVLYLDGEPWMNITDMSVALVTALVRRVEFTHVVEFATVYSFAIG